MQILPIDPAEEVVPLSLTGMLRMLKPRIEKLEIELDKKKSVYATISKLKTEEGLTFKTRVNRDEAKLIVVRA